MVKAIPSLSFRGKFGCSSSVAEVLLNVACTQLPPHYHYSVHEQINFGPASTKWGPDEERVNKFVFIGKGLDRKELTKGLMECLYKEDDNNKA